MTKSKIKKQTVDKIGRTFALLFNREAMYGIDHPFTTQSVADFYKTITKGLNTFSPIVLIMHRDQFFIEEEPLDPRINVSKMLIHFKNTGLKSISFEKGMKNNELKVFVEVFTNINKYSTADRMKKALSGNSVNKVKINHVFFKKVTADDAVVSKDKLKDMPEGTPKASQIAMKKELMDMMVGSIVMEELGKSFSMKNLMDNPTGLSKTLIDTDLSASKGSDEGKGKSGSMIVEQLSTIREEVDKAVSDTGKESLPELAEAVFDMKKDLLKQIEAQKAMGVIYENEGMIRNETDAITDRVLIQLVREEYKKGKISVQRLGQIIRRLVPEPGELRRLLPKLKEALIEEGMSLPEFAQLAQELGKELQSEELAQALQKSSEEIGVDGEDLIREILINPTGAAELIYLASEIRQEAGDEKVLSDLLVDYVERIGSKMALDTAEQKGEEGGKHLKEVISKVESELVNSLKQKDIDTDVISTVEKRLKERMEECFSKLQSDWVLRNDSSSDSVKDKTILSIFEEGGEEGDELRTILEKVRTSVQRKSIDENDFQQILNEISKSKLDHAKEKQEKVNQQKEQKKKEKPGLPKGVLNRKSTLYFIEKEISRSARYGTPFSAILLSIIKVTPEKPIPKGSVKRDDIINAVLENIARAVRDTDVVGLLDQKKIVALLPMTEKMESKLAMRRIMKILQAGPFIINDIPMAVKLAGMVTAYNRDRAPTLKSFIKTAENELYDMINRLKNVQTLY